MAEAISTVLIDGENIATPGAYSTLDTTEAQQPGLVVGSIVAIVADLVGGEPQKRLEFFSLSQIRKAFKFATSTTPLANNMSLMGRLLYNASDDELISGAPSKVVVVKANRDTQATGVLQGTSGPLINLTSEDYGAHVNQWSVSVGLGTTGGVSLQIVGLPITESFDNLGADRTFEVEYSGEADAMVVDVVAGTDLKFTYTHAEAGLSVSEIGAAWNATDVASVSSSSTNDDHQNVTIYGVSGGVAVAETLALNGTATVTGTQAFDTVTGVHVKGLNVGTVTVTDQSANTAATFTFTASAAIATPPDTLSVVSTDASDVGQGVQIVGVSGNGIVIAETVILNGTTQVLTTNKFSRLQSVQIVGVTAGPVSVRDEDVTNLVTVPSGTDSSVGLDNTKGLFLITTIPVDGTVTLSATAAVEYVLRGVNAAGVQVAERFSGTGPFVSTNTFQSISQLELGRVGTGESVTITGLSATFSGTQTLFDLDAAMDTLVGFDGESFNDDRLVVDLDSVAAVSIKGSGLVGLFSQAQDVIDAINAVSQLVTAVRVTAASGLPLITPPVTLSGGTSVTSTVADVQAALTLLAQDKSIRWVMPAYTSQAIHSLVKDHIKAQAKASAKGERRAVVPLDPTLNKAVIKSQTVALNNERVGTVVQRRGYFDDFGVLQVGDSISMALGSVGMFAASEIGEPNTAKFLAAQSVTQDGDWDPSDDGDREELLRAGLMFTEPVEGTGNRWVRSITTYQRRKDRIRTEMSSMESADESLRDLRDTMQAKLIGRKNVLLTDDGIRNLAEGRLQQQIAEGIIAAFRNVTVSGSGDTRTISYEVAPVEPNNFVLLEAHVFTPQTTSAAA